MLRFFIKASVRSTRACHVSFILSERISSAINNPTAPDAVNVLINMTAMVKTISSHLVGTMSPRPTVVIVPHAQ